jgi:septum formation protein
MISLKAVLPIDSNSAVPALVLASASPRRLALLAQIGVTPDLIEAPDINEASRVGELPRPYAQRMAREKALLIARKHPHSLVLAADTVVAMGRRILPKAEAQSDVQACLDLLSGRSHRVYTAICVCGPVDDGGLVSEKIVETRLKFKSLSYEDKQTYLNTGEGIGKAGGYAIQGLAGIFVLSLNGSYSAVVGLPLPETYHCLRAQGYKPQIMCSS